MKRLILSLSIFFCLHSGGAGSKPRSEYSLAPLGVNTVEVRISDTLGSKGKVLHAVKHNNRDMLLVYLKDEHPDRYRDSETKHTALTLAVEKGDCDMVKKLLANNANPNLPGPCEHTPLQIAEDLNHYNVIDCLDIGTSCID